MSGEESSTVAMTRSARLPTMGLLLGGAAIMVALRAWAGRCGATPTEASASWPADDIVQQPHIQTTHAVIVDAEPSRVWPWIVQLGYYRGGWNTDTGWWDYLPDRYLRFLVRDEVRASGVGHRDEPTAERIVPEYQQLHVGEMILDGPPGTAFFTVVALEPGRVLALYSDTHARFLFPKTIRDNSRWPVGGEFTWVFVVKEVSGGSRLVLRTRARAHPWAYRFFLTAFLPLVDALMARKMLGGIKRQAEHHPLAPAQP